jgi:hypothetical protein
MPNSTVRVVYGSVAQREWGSQINQQSRTPQHAYQQPEELFTRQLRFASCGIFDSGVIEV